MTEEQIVSLVVKALQQQGDLWGRRFLSCKKSHTSNFE